MEGAVVLEVFHPLLTVVFSSKMACIDQHSSLVARKFSPGCPYQQHGNKMARGLEGVKGSVLEGGKCRGSRSIGLLSLASVWWCTLTRWLLLVSLIHSVELLIYVLIRSTQT